MYMNTIWRPVKKWERSESESGTGPAKSGPHVLLLPAFYLRSLVLSIILALGPLDLHAQGWVEPIRPIPGSWVQRVKSEVRVEVKGNVATVVVDEWFESHGRALGEADYLYPLPPDAVFNGFSLYQGGEELRGEIMDADEARKIYEEIVRKRRDPALIELAGHGLLRARIFPMNPGENRKVTLRYSQLLQRAGDALHLQYAGGVPNSTNCSTGGSAPPNRCVAAAAQVEMEIRVPRGDSFLEPFSPTHPLEATRDGSTLLVKAQGNLAGPFSLFLPLARDVLGLTLATHKPLGEDGYFLLSLSPGRGDVAPEPRDVTVVLDVSGSMSGEKIRQARSALLDLLNSLAWDDRFRLVAFSNAVRPFNLEWRKADPEALSRAREWVSGLHADGGTNISGALDEALRLGSPDHRLPVTIFLTDGLPTVGEMSPEVIASAVDHRRGRTRVFAFGVGHDVNTALLDRITEEGRGSTSYVSPGESIERALSLLTAKVKHPVLTDLALEGSPVRIKEVFPVEIPDVFVGEELVLFGRYETDGEPLSGVLRFHGRRGGKAAEFALEADFPHVEEANAFIPRLWASRKLGFLTRRIWTAGENEELIAEIRETALRYGLPSPYTSYLVLEEGAREDQLLRDGGGAPQRQPRVSPAVPSFSVRGAEAVGQARKAKALREVGSTAELRIAEEETQVSPTDSDENLRRIAGRLFQREDGVWKQAGVRKSDEVLRIEPFSRAYFDLLDRIPVLQSVAQEFDRFEIQGVTLRIRIQEGGVATLSPDALRTTRARFLVGDRTDW
jgi:Ca-activated chloride channel family protein